MWHYYCQFGSKNIQILLIDKNACFWYCSYCYKSVSLYHDVIKWKHFPRYWPFVRGINRSPVNSPHKGQWRGALMFSLIYDWINGWVNNDEAGDLRRHRAHYNVTVMSCIISIWFLSNLCLKGWSWTRNKRKIDAKGWQIFCMYTLHKSRWQWHGQMIHNSLKELNNRDVYQQSK